MKEEDEDEDSKETTEDDSKCISWSKHVDVISSKLSIKELLTLSRGRSCIFTLPKPEYLYNDLVNRNKKQDIHCLECVVKGCTNICVKIHPLCQKHSAFFNIIIDKSTVPNAGVGVFITTSVRKGTHIMDYTGVIRDSQDLYDDYEEAETRSFYEVGIDDDTSLDARSTLCGIGRYINHHPNPKYVNVEFEYDERLLLYKIISTKDIWVSKKGKTELFLDYGPTYWQDESPEIPDEIDIRMSCMRRRDNADFTEPENFHVYPAYESIVYDNNFYENRKLDARTLAERCSREIVQFPIEAPKMMLTALMDLSRRQNVFQLPCIIKDCTNICTYVHPICRKHLRSYFHIDIRPSTISSGGSGVFLLSSVRSGSALMLITGNYLKRDKLYKLYKQKKANFYYLFEDATKHAIDARSTVCGLARYINHQDGDVVNVELQAGSHETFFTAIAKRDILVPRGGEVELFADYGSAYWRHRQCQAVSRKSVPVSIGSTAGKVNENFGQVEPFVDPFPVVPAYMSI